MNTIHSSSLTTQPIAYSKPESQRIEKKQVADNVINKAQQAIASPEQIKTAITDKALTTTTNNPIHNARAAKALMSYASTQNQPQQTPTASSITALVDIYV